MIQEPLVSISEASHILGVSEVSLRQWTDEGKIKAFITPGGHRRYSKLELKKFIGSQRKILGTRDLAVELEESTSKHREIITAFLRDTAWYNKLDELSQEKLSSSGRRLLDLIIKSVIEPSKKDEVLKGVRDVGYGFGETLAELKFPLIVSIQAFIQHRDLIIAVTTRLMKKRQGLNPRLVQTIPVIDHAMDEALVALMGAYQRGKDIYQNGRKGEPEIDIGQPSAL